MRRMVALLLAVCMLFGLNEGSVSIAKNSSDNGIVPIFAGEETEEESSAFEEEYGDSESLSAIEETSMDDNMEEVGESTLQASEADESIWETEETENIKFDSNEFEQKDTVELVDDEIEYITAIELTTDELELKVGETRQLIANIVPNESAESLRWISNDEPIVKVDENGFLTAVGVGETTVRVESQNGIVSSECKIVVVPSSVMEEYIVNEEILAQNYELFLTSTASSMREQAANIAYSQLGTVGGSKYYASGESGSWCVYFARWCVRQAGLDASKWGSTGSTTALIAWFQNKERWHDKVSYTWAYGGRRGGGKVDSYVPQPGDFAAVENNGNNSDGPDHTALVYSVDISKNELKTIEGNISNKVVQRVYRLSDLYLTSGSSTENRKTHIVGFGEPAYDGDQIVVGHQPIGAVDEVTGGEGIIRVRGWAFDYDDTSAQLEIRICIGGKEYPTKANLARPDVNQAYGGNVGNYHGFDTTFKVDVRGSQQADVYAIDVGDKRVDNAKIGSKTTTINNIPFSITYKNSEVEAKVDESVAVNFDFTGDGIYTMNYAIDDPSMIKFIGYDSVDWNAGNAAIAIEALKAGETTLYMNLVDSNNRILFTKGIKIKAIQPVTGISLNKASTVVSLESQEQLIATVKPDNAVNKSVLWSSSDESVAKIRVNGTIRPVSAGTTTITAKTSDGGYTATCRVTITQPVTGISLNKTSTVVPLGSQEQLIAAVKPDNATDKYVLWSSSDENVAKIRVNGTIRPASVGTTTITAKTYDGGYTATCQVTVTEPETGPVTGVSLDKKNVKIVVGKTETLTATISPSGTTNKNTIWSSSNTDVATVNNGVITAKKTGNTIITVKTNDGGYTAECEVEVIEGIEFDKSNIKMQIGETIGLNLQALPAQVSYYPSGVKFFSSDTDIAEVNNELCVFAISGGTATITAQTDSGEILASCEVTVIQPVTGILLSKASIALMVGETEQLTVGVMPADATDKTVTWISSNPDVADVNSEGKITAKSKGTAVVTVESQDGKFIAACNVTVIKSDKVQIWMNDGVGEAGSTGYMESGYNLNGEALQSKIWESSDSSIISIDKDTGFMKMLKPGIVTITLTINGVSSTATMKVICVELNKSEMTLSVGSQERLNAEVLPDMLDYSVTNWESDNVNVADVMDGVVTANEEGTAVITYSYGSFKASCKINVIDVEEVRVTGISLDKEAVTMSVGDKETLTEEVYPIDATDKSVIWDSSNTDVINVKDDSGTIIAEGIGTAVVTARTYDGGYSASCQITVVEKGEIPKDEDIQVEEIVLDNDALEMCRYDELVLGYSVKPVNTTNPAVIFYSSDANVVSVNEEGKLTAKNIGKADITVESVSNGVNAVCHVTVIDNQLGNVPDGLWISGLRKNVNYTGSAIKQDINVYHGNMLLREKTDYTVSYKNNTNVGDAQIIVTGKGNYTGKATETFKIDAIDFESNPDISINVASAAATGKRLKPSVAITWKGKKLKEKKDYVLSYSSNIIAASKDGYNVTILGTGNYSGYVEKKFYVKEKGAASLSRASVTGIAKSYSYYGGDAVGPDADDIVVKIGNKTLAKDVDYAIRMENNNYVGTGTVIIEPTDKSDYAGIKKINFSIVGTDLKKGSIIGLGKEYVYTGDPITPEVYVFSGKNGSGTMVPTDSYKISYRNNVDQGRATITITGLKEKGFSGSISKTYKISRLKIDDKNISVEMPDDIEYEKGGAKPLPVITYDHSGKKSILKEGVDYTLKYSNNASVNGETLPVLKITGIGNYSGTITKNYNMVEQDIGELTIAVADKKYNGKKKAGFHFSVPKVYDKNGKQLKAGKDYTVSYMNALTGQVLGKNDTVVSGMKIRVTVSGKGNYIGTLSAVYFIRESKDISKIKNDKIVNQQYTGKEIKPDVGLYIGTVGNKTYLTKGVDYQVVGYYNNIKKGTASILIKGIGTYSGSKIITFKVVSANNKLIWKGAF